MDFKGCKVFSHAFLFTRISPVDYILCFVESSVHSLALGFPKDMLMLGFVKAERIRAIYSVAPWKTTRIYGIM